MGRIMIVAGILLAGPVEAEPSLWLREQTGNMHRITGPFVNEDYGFRIVPPPGAAEYVTDGGDANHGAVLILGDGRKIDVYPEYAGFAPEDARPCRRNQFPWEQNSIRTVTTGRLDGCPACVKTVVRSGIIRRVMQTTGSDRGTPIMYILLLTTTPRWAHDDFRSLRRVANSFRRIPITP